MDSETERNQGEADAYWRRRVYVLAGGITVIGLMAWACSNTGHKKSTAQLRNAAATASPASAPATPLAAVAVPTATVTVTATPSVTASAGPRDGDRCDDADVVLGLTPTRDVYTRGAHPRFRLSVVNTGRHACTFDAGAKALRVRITSGSDLVWASDRCAAGPPADLQLLKRGVPYIVDVDWNRRRCDGTTKARPGTYVITAKAHGRLRAGRHVFRLR